MANGLGHFIEGLSMGKSVNGMAVLGGLHAGHSSELQVEGRCNTVCTEARVRIFCARAERAENHTEGICEQLCTHSKEAKGHKDEVAE